VLPGVGPRSAQRMAYHLLQHDRAGADQLAQALSNALETVRRCAKCNNFSEEDLCSLCRSPRRDASLLCVVETPADLAMVEQTLSYSGMYFVLMGRLSPLDGVGPRDIGLYGIVTTTAMTVVALRRVGIDEAFVQQREADQEEEFQRAFTLELMIGAAFSLILVLGAPVVALAYGDWRLLPLMLAVSYLPTAFALQAPTWVFFRRMDFLRVRVLQALVPLITFCVTVPLAAAGVGVPRHRAKFHLDRLVAAAVR